MKITLTAWQEAAFENSQVDKPWPIHPSKPWLTSIVWPVEPQMNYESIKWKKRGWKGELDGVLGELVAPARPGELLEMGTVQVRVKGVLPTPRSMIGRKEPMAFFALGLSVDNAGMNATHERAAYVAELDRMVKDLYPGLPSDPWLWLIKFVKGPAGPG